MRILKNMKSVIIIFSLTAVIIGLVKVNIINTNALSPLGNSKENYEKIKESFGDEFSKFINDNSFVKIYKEDNFEGILVRIGDRDYIIKKQSYIVEKVEDAIEEVSDFYNEIFEVLIE